MNLELGPVMWRGLVDKISYLQKPLDEIDSKIKLAASTAPPVKISNASINASKLRGNLIIEYLKMGPNVIIPPDEIWTQAGRAQVEPFRSPRKGLPWEDGRSQRGRAAVANPEDFTRLNADIIKMRDPWFPIALILAVLLTVWLGILGPLPNGVAGWLQQWQTLVSAMVALIAAYIAFRNTSRSLQHAERLERHRRSRKHVALRARLSLALAQIMDYTTIRALAQRADMHTCDGETLPETLPEPVSESIAEGLPSEALITLAEFIEYSETVDVSTLESTIALIQIFDSRLHSLVSSNRYPLSVRIVPQAELEARIIDAASIYAGAASAFEYARRQRTELPHAVSWDNVKAALRNMNFWDEQYSRLHEILDRSRAESAGPFASLNRQPEVAPRAARG
jgi:hypothetical protein